MSQKCSCGNDNFRVNVPGESSEYEQFINCYECGKVVAVGKDCDVFKDAYFQK